MLSLYGLGPTGDLEFLNRYADMDGLLIGVERFSHFLFQVIDGKGQLIDFIERG